MSNEVNDVQPQELNSQLRNYGQWLERRSDVALSPVDVDVVAGDAEESALPSGPPVGPRLLAVAVAGIALLALAAIGLGAIGGSAETDNVATASADEGGLDIPTSNVEDPPAAATERQDASPAASAEATGDGAAADGETAGDDMTDSTATAAPAPTDDAATEAEGSAQVAEPEVFNDEALTPSTLVLEEGQTTIRPSEGGGATAPGFLFVSPRDGQTLNLNASNTIEARLVAGAASYTFEVWQNGAKALEISTAERTFLMPNQMLTGNPTMSAGQVELRVTASDASGSVMATGKITVTMEGAPAAAPGVTTGPWPTNG